MLCTDIPQADNNFRHTITESRMATTLSKSRKYDSKCYYLFTDVTVGDNLPYTPSYYVSSDTTLLGSIDRQLTIIGLSVALFKDAKALEGEELNLMNKTYSRLFSKTPTRL